MDYTSQALDELNEVLTGGDRLHTDLDGWSDADLLGVSTAYKVIWLKARELRVAFAREIERRAGEQQMDARYGTLSVAEAEAVLARARARDQVVSVHSATLPGA